jgi:hypothetical protein
MANPKGNPQNLKPFKPGNNANPGGKPEGARNRLTAKFLHELAEDFERHGKKAIVKTREADPATYLKVCAALVPKEMSVEVKHSFTDILKHLERERRATATGALGAGVAEEPDERAPVRH